MPIWFDETISTTEAIRFLNKHLKLIHQLQMETHFDREEIENLLIIHYKLCKQGGKLNSKKFCDISHVIFNTSDEDMCDRLYGQFDPHRVGHITAERWCRALSVVLRGSFSEQIDFVWDMNKSPKSGFVTKDMMVTYHRHSIIKPSVGEDVMEVVKDFVDMILKKMDLDGDGKLSRDDFTRSVKKNPLLLEAFGLCLPTRASQSAFLATLTTKTPRSGLSKHSNSSKSLTPSPSSDSSHF